MSDIKLPIGYRPSDEEVYMNPMHLEYFKQKLLFWKNDLLEESKETLRHLQEDNLQEPDFHDRAAVESETSFELRSRARYLKLIDKIELALEKIENAEYGFCEESGEKIGLSRLEARPIATLTIEAQEKHENYERQHSDDE
jgi:DnaK suppressor protein